VRLFLTYFDHHVFGFWLSLVIVVLLLLVWLTAAERRRRRLADRFNETLGRVEGQNVPAMLTEYLNTVSRIAEQSGQMEERVNQLSAALPSVVSHVGLVRFSPFHDTGGDHSFSMAILDSRGDGVVVTALHSRQEHKLFAKPVTNRTSRYALTNEEREAIDKPVAVEAAPAAGSGG